MKKPKQNKYMIITLFQIIIFSLIVVAVLGVAIYVWTEYGGKPITEIPAWALYFMWGKN
ncbi:MAG: hypothetical protein IJQ23_01370 [Clostridia bacterium]|nr:hypothetical protein [Clostridia bacterium]